MKIPQVTVGKYSPQGHNLNTCNHVPQHLNNFESNIVIILSHINL
jgi:hypothetical protein